MSNIWFISDTHLGHRNVLKYSPCREGSTVEEHDEAIIESIEKEVKKRDILYVLGDIAYSQEGLQMFSRINCEKRAILGNHDKFTLREYSKYFKILPGIIKRNGFWLTHCPIHTDELRGNNNIHGHTHNHIIDDDRYLNVCVEQCLDGPVSLNEIREIFKIRGV